MAGYHTMNVSDCTCSLTHTAIVDMDDVNLFECALKDQCSTQNVCPNDNFVCLSDYETGNSR